MQTKIFLAALCLCTGQAFGQQTDSLSPFRTWPSITASADAYYRFNTNASAGLTNNYTRFTASQNSFELGMASVTLSHAYKKVSAVADMGFGRRAEELNYTDGDHPSLFAVKQLYMTYRPSERWNITVGKFFANTGYERVDAYQNEQYSSSYLFTYGPLFFTGIKAEVRLKGKNLPDGRPCQSGRFHHHHIANENRHFLPSHGRPLGAAASGTELRGLQRPCHATVAYHQLPPLQRIRPGKSHPPRFGEPPL